MSNSTARVTVLRGGTIWTGGANPKTYFDHDLVMHDGVVTAIEPEYKGRVDLELDATEALVAPGLINAHCHPGSTPRARGVAEDIELGPGAAYYHSIIPLLKIGVTEMPAEQTQAIIEWDTIAILLGGATTVVGEMITSLESGSHDMWIDLVRRLGFRGQFGLTYPNKPGAIGYIENGKVVMGDGGDIAGTLKEALHLHDIHNGAFGDRLRVHLSPHGPDTVPEDILRETKKLCRERGIHAHLHLAQHESERDTVAKRSGGKSSVAYLDDIGFLGPDVMATHVTYIEPGDIEILARTGTHVVHASYRKAKEGIASPFWDYLKGGVNVAIATDSFSHDLIQDMKMAAMIGKVKHGSVGHPSANEVLTCATHGAAKALGRPDLGHLNPGARGDVLVVNMNSPYNAPVFDALRSLIYYSTASDIRYTLVDGSLVVKNGEVVGTNMQAVRKRAKAACEALWERAVDQKALPPGISYRGRF